ncbi:MAG: aldehyde dehydrogenase [Bacteroidia bacterium]|nr:aldehyde dehydrogenase [Bacteroidia bacterium]
MEATIRSGKTEVQAQRSYFEQGKTLSYESRRAALLKLQGLITAHETEIYKALEADLGKCAMEAYTTEVGFVQADIHHTLKKLRGWMRPKRAKTGWINFPGKSRIHSEPFGVTLNIAPWNYPFQLALAPAIGAISAGNTMVIKPSELAPHTAAVLEVLINKNFDKGLLHVVKGGVQETTALLEQKWDYIFFTGGTKVGKIVYEAAARHLTPVTLELGGKSPTIVDKDSPLELTARRIAWGKFLNSGQTCVAPDYILVHEQVKIPFVQALEAEIERSYGKDPVSNPEYGRIINERHFERLESLLADTRILSGGKTDRNRCKIAPTIVEPDSTSSVMQDEIFGPVLPVISFKNADEVIAEVNARPKPLAMYIFSNNSEFRNRILKHTSAGGVTINDTVMHMSGAHLPFGGVGDSGIGAYHGRFSFDTFSHKKPVLTRAFWLDAPLRYPPYNKVSLNFMRKLLKHVL